MSRQRDANVVGEAMSWASRIMAIGLTMFIPAVVGGWLDDRWGTAMLGPLGLVAGFSVAIIWLARIGRSIPERRRLGRPATRRPDHPS
jgi:hypothetical protein